MDENLILVQPEKVDNAKSMAYLLLFLTAFAWGMSTILSKICVGTISPAHILMVRSVIATLVIFLAAPRRIMTISREDLKAGVVLGIVVFVAYFFGISALLYTTASKAAFLMAFNVLFVPAIEAVFRRRLPSKWIVLSVVLSLLGLKLISGINGEGFNFGDLLAVLCAAAYTVYTIMLDRLGHDKDDYVLSFIQLAVLGICAFFAVVLFEQIDFAGVRESLLPLFIMGVLGTGLATLFQTMAQKTASTESVGIILLADPLFTLLLAFVFLHEPIFLSGLLGGGLIMLSCMIAIIKKV